VVNGKVVGTWKRVQKKDVTWIEPSYFHPVSEKVRKQVEDKALKYGRFIDQKTMQP
jgi:hypothetical protein